MSVDEILVVEDDAQLGAQIVEHLEGEGFTVSWLRDGDSARKADLSGLSLVVLDLMLPGTYGLDLLKHYRKSSDVPVLILSARNETSDKVRGLELGADDYLTKPFWPEELIARVKARLRRPAMARGDHLVVGPIRLHEDERSVEVGGTPIDLTKVEFELLHALMRRSGSAISRAALVDAALDPDRQGNERTLDVHVSRLRKKLADHGALIETVWGIGYRLREKA